MRSPDRPEAIPFLLVGLLLLADIGSGGLFDEALPRDTLPDSGLGPGAVEWFWQGGGARIPFADDMSSATAFHYAGMAKSLPFYHLEKGTYVRDGKPFDYYGGAIPAPRTDDLQAWQADRWRDDLLRWGQEGSQQLAGGELLPLSAWSWSGGAWQLGNDSTGATYPSGLLAGVASPIVDLRTVTPLLPEVSPGVHAGGASFHAKNALAGPNVQGDRVLQNLPNNTNGPQTLVAADGDGQGAQADSSPLQAAAALRLRHAYGFEFMGTELYDGGRVEASSYDARSDHWSDWAGLEPTTRALKVNDATLEGGLSVSAARDAPGTRIHQVGVQVQAQVDASGLPGGDPGMTGVSPGSWVDADPVNRSLSLPRGLVSTQREAVEGALDQSIDGSTDPSAVPASTVQDFPWLHRGPIIASNQDQLDGPWSGFGGDSGGWVESVFDLTSYAGSVVRFRFLAATRSASLGLEPVAAGLGWRLGQLEVSAAGIPGIAVVDLASPGDGATLSPEAAQPKNDFHPVVVLQNEATGAVQAGVSATLDGQHPSTDKVKLGSAARGRELHALQGSFHHLAGERELLGLHLLNVTAKQVHTPGAATVAGPGPVTSRTFHFQLGGGTAWRVIGLETDADADGRLVLRGQKMTINATLENLGPESLTLDLEHGILPVLRALNGAQVGKADPAGKQAGKAVTLQLEPSRAVSGAFGHPASAVPVSWTWGGTAMAQPLHLLMEDQEKVVRLDGGMVRVEAMMPDAMDVDLGNLWNRTGGCSRQLELMGHTGVLRCAGAQSARSPVTPLSQIQLLEGNQTRLVLTHNGTGGVVRLLGNNLTKPSEPAPVEAEGWQVLGQVALQPTLGWRTETIDLPDFPHRWEGWLRLEVETSAGDERLIDQARVEVGPSERSLPVFWHTLDVEFLPESVEFSALNGGDVVRLTGRALQQPNHPAAPYVYAEAHADTALTLNQSLALDGARPMLRFRHHLADAQGFRGLVEIQQQQSSGVPQPDQPAPWIVVAAFDPAQDARPGMSVAQVRLWDFAGQDVLLRFRYEVQAHATVTGSPLGEVGWILGDVRVDLVAQNGLKILHESGRNLLDQYATEGIVETDRTLDGPNQKKPKEESGAYHFKALSHECQMKDTYLLGPAAISDPVDLRAMQAPVLSLSHSGMLANLRRSGAPVHMDLDLEYQFLGADQAWGPWHSATQDPSGLRDPQGQLVPHLFTEGFQANALVGSWEEERFTTSFVLQKSIFAGEVARFRVHFWETLQDNGVAGKSNCMAAADWHVYGMRIREPQHLTDASLASISVTLDDSGLLDRLAPGAIRGREDAAVVAVEHSAFEVRANVTNEGRLPLANRVSLALDAPGARISFIDTSGGSPVPIAGRPFGQVALQSGESALVRFRVELPHTPPGDYVLSARVTATDALDTNPSNDFLARRLIVQPFRALTVDRGDTLVSDFVGTSDDPRTVQLRLRNEGNVLERSVAIHAEVVERAGLTEMTPIGYVLFPETVALAPRTGSIVKKWDLPDSRVGGLLDPVTGPSPGAASLQLVAGTPSGLGYIERVTALRLRPGDFGSTVASGHSDFAYSLHDTPSDWMGLATYPLGPEPKDVLVALDLDRDGRIGVGDVVLGRQPQYEAGVRISAADPNLSAFASGSTAVNGRFTFVDLDDSKSYSPGDPLYLNRGGDGRLGAFSIRMGGALPDSQPGTLVLQASGDEALFGTDQPVAMALASFAGSLADNLEFGKRYAVEFRVQPAADSVTQWWDEADPDKPLDSVAPSANVDLTDEVPELLDITDLGKCGCARAPFIVERRLWATGMDSGLTPVVSFPADADWTAETLVEENGAFVAADERPDLPAWRLVDGADPSLPAPGAAGKAWLLPAYDGLESIESTLTSPALPAHLIQSSSQAFLEMRYASGLESELATLETRTLLGGQWSDWEPADGLKSRRVAVVLAPDFPRVTGTWIPSGAWVGNASAVSGLTPSAISPEAFTMGTNLYIISGGGPNDGFLGFRWNEADGRWNTDDVITSGLVATISSYPTVFQMDSKTYLITGKSNGTFDGYVWDEAQTSWVRNAGIVSGLHTVTTGRSIPEVLTLESGTYLVAPFHKTLTSGGAFDGYRWDGTQWRTATAVASGLVYSDDSIHRLRQFNLEGLTYLAVTRDGGTSTGYVWAGTGWNRLSSSLLNVAPGIPVWFELDGQTYLAVRSTTTPDTLTGFQWVRGAGAGYPISGALPLDGHPIPPFYTSYTGSNQDQPAGCSHPTGGLCSWSPFPAARPDGDPEWVRALADTLRSLAETLGPENVGVFTTLEHDGAPNPDLLLPDGPLDPASAPLKRDGTWLHVTRPDNPQGEDEYRFPLRDLDALGMRLERYGSILLLGDNATTTFAERSRTLNDLSPDRFSGLPATAAWPADPADAFAGLVSAPTSQIPTDLSLQHHEALFEILNAAPLAGVRTVGAIGPASATLALSGMDLQGTRMTAWLTPGIPQVDRPKERQLQCLSPGSSNLQHFPEPGTPTWYNPTQTSPGSPVKPPPPFGPLAVQVQPKAACMAVAPLTPDLTSAWNYWYVSAPDARSIAIRDFLRAAGVQADERTVITRNACPQHPLNSLGAGFLICVLPSNVTVEPARPDSPAVVTAAYATNAAEWTAAVLQTLDRQGLLPEGTGQWQALSPTLSTPVGGRFVLDEDGGDHYDGAPMQLRLRVQSEPSQRGHGWFLLDHFGLLGTNFTSDIGVRVALPLDGASLEPGETGFHPLVEVSNRGTTDLEGLIRVQVDMTQVLDCGGECWAIPQTPVTVLVDGGLPAGTQRVITLGGDAVTDRVQLPSVAYLGSPQGFFDGSFPKGESTAFRIEAGRQPPSGPDPDSYALNDGDAVTVVGLTQTSPLLRSEDAVRLLPNRGASHSLDQAVLYVALHNDGSIKQQAAQVTVELRDAMPQHCAFQGPRTGFWPCEQQGRGILPLNRFPPLIKNTLVSRGQTLDLAFPLDVDGLGTGVYQVTMTLRTQASDGTPLAPQTVMRWLHLDEEGTDWPNGHAFYYEATRVGMSTDYMPPDTDGDGLRDMSSPYSFFGGRLCAPDATTDLGDGPRTDTPLLHGWRLSSDGQDPCMQFQDPLGTPVLEWRRDERPSTTAGEEWGPQQVGSTTPPEPAQYGANDFGPDGVIWHPLRELEGQEVTARNPEGTARNPFDKNKPNGPALSLAAFEPGAARLAIESQYRATPNTAYVVVMQVPFLACGPGGGNFAHLGQSCGWQWTTSDWLPLTGSATSTAPPGTTADMGGTNCPLANEQNPNSARCKRLTSNPMVGLPGLWGGGNAVDAGEPWPVLDYFIDDAHQPLLAAYCNGVASQDWEDTAGLPVTSGFRACQFARSQGGNFESSEGGPSEIPRPVRFRLLAASFGGDTGLNFWMIKSMALTEHRLTIEGPQVIALDLLDGQSDAVPVRVHNAGAVRDTVRVTAQATDLASYPDVQVGLSRQRTQAPDPEGLPPISLDPGEEAKVWVHVGVGLKTGLQDLGSSSYPLPVRVVAQSMVDPSASATARVDASFKIRPWANLAVDQLAVGGDATQGVAQLASGVPVSLTVGFANRGDLPIGGPGQPIEVRFEDQGPGGQVIAIKTLQGPLMPCKRQGCTVFETVEWTPDAQGPRRLVVNVNPSDDPASLLPENDYSDNQVSRDVHVGPVKAVELLPLNAWMVPFTDAGCATDAPPVRDLVAGHAYCVAVVVRNAGLLPAKGPQVQFSVDSSDGFSWLTGCAQGRTDCAPSSLPDPFPGDTTLTLFSPSAWTASRRSDDGGERNIRVQVVTGGSNSALEPFLSHAVHVDEYALQLPDGQNRTVGLRPGEQVVVHVNVTNLSTAVATPVSDSGNSSALRVHVEQAPPLLPGETAQIRIVLAASLALRSDDALPQVVLSTQEDPAVALPLPLQFHVALQASATARALPLRAGPGPADVEVVLDSADSGVPTRWTLSTAAFPLASNASTPVDLPAFGRALVRFPVRVEDHAAPGTYAGNMTFQRVADGIERTLQVPYALEVEARPDLQAQAAEQASAPQGRAATILVRVGNSGNVPVEVALATVIDHGSSAAGPARFQLDPGASRNVTVEVLGDASLRSIGAVNVSWRPQMGEWRSGLVLPWSVDFHPAVVRIADTDLDSLHPVTGRVQAVRVSLENPGVSRVEAEVLLVLDGAVQSQRVIAVEPGQVAQTTLAFRAGEESLGRFLVVARPVGVLLSLDDSTFYDVGDAASGQAAVSQPTLLDRATPAPPVSLLLLALVALAFCLRRRAP